MKITLTGEEIPVDFFHSTLKDPPFSECCKKDKWNLSYPSMMTAGMPKEAIAEMTKGFIEQTSPDAVARQCEVSEDGTHFIVRTKNDPQP